MKAKKILASISLSWLLMTLFIDIKAVPTVFRNVSSRLEAGRVGMDIFSTFNYLEVVFACILLLLCLRFLSIKKMWLIVIPLFILPFSYAFYLTPEITDIALKIGLGVEEGFDVSKLEAQHEIFHSLYTKLDGFKIILLMVLVGFSFKNESEA